MKLLKNIRLCIVIAFSVACIFLPTVQAVIALPIIVIGVIAVYAAYVLEKLGVV